MKKVLFPALIILFLAAACKGPVTTDSRRVVTVSIPPFRYFIEAIADSDFVVNVMLPPGADHHSWEPLPRQITALAGSEAFFIDGYLGFENAWLGRFKEVNTTMKISNLSDGVSLILPITEHQGIGNEHEGHAHEEGIDPHYWLSPKEAPIIAANVNSVLKALNPSQSKRYDLNYSRLLDKIAYVDTVVRHNLKEISSPAFMIFHPALAYMARDYGLEQISFEDEGKMPSPARMKELVDFTREKRMKIIFVQAEYDIKSAGVIAAETGTKLVVINPMNTEWDKCVIEISNALSGKTKD